MHINKITRIILENYYSKLTYFYYIIKPEATYIL